jgi:hypothetical protein
MPGATDPDEHYIPLPAPSHMLERYEHWREPAQQSKDETDQPKAPGKPGQPRNPDHDGGRGQHNGKLK